MGTIKKCVITRYDDSITEPPFKTIPVGMLEVCAPYNGSGIAEGSGLKA